MADGFIISRGGNKHQKKTTHGWELLAQMKEGFSKWVSLNDLKEYQPGRDRWVCGGKKY